VAVDADCMVTPTLQEDATTIDFPKSRETGENTATGEAQLLCPMTNPHRRDSRTPGEDGTTPNPSPDYVFLCLPTKLICRNEPMNSLEPSFVGVSISLRASHNPSVRHHCPQSVIRWLDENNKKNNRPITSEGVELVRLRHLTSH
jgi:hypothetical protein